MSDNDDDYMCEEEEDYGLVSNLFLILQPILVILLYHDVLLNFMYFCT